MNENIPIERLLDAEYRWDELRIKIPINPRLLDPDPNPWIALLDIAAVLNKGPVQDKLKDYILDENFQCGCGATVFIKQAYAVGDFAYCRECFYKKVDSLLIVKFYFEESFNGEIRYYFSYEDQTHAFVFEIKVLENYVCVTQLIDAQFLIHFDGNIEKFCKTIMKEVKYKLEEGITK